jgi:hypothetical protein
MNSREYMGPRRARDYDFVEQLHAVQELTQRDADEQSSELLALLVVEIGYAIRNRGCSVEDVVNAIHRLQPSGGILDDAPTRPSRPQAKAKQALLRADRTGFKWRRWWRDLLMKGKK